MLTLSRLPFMAAEVFNCELSKLTDLFFTSREESLGTTAKQAPSSPNKKEIQSSPLPREEEEEEDNDEQDEDEEEED
jgi:hypothetical protein